jgi:hypothetical protein
MKDPLLVKLMRSAWFNRLTKPERMTELDNYHYQRKNFRRTTA